MGLYIIGGRGAGGSRNAWVPGDPGTPNSADSKEELLSQTPKPEPLACSNAECGNQTQVYSNNRRGAYWSWVVNRFCRRCFDLRRKHGLELPELIAIWEAQDRRCYRPGCGRMLTDPRLPSEGRRQAIHGPDDTWRISIDHDHRICPREGHSCAGCRRGLVCTTCNCHPLSIRATGMWLLPKGAEGLTRWLEFLGPADRDRLRAGLTMFPEQPVRRVPRRPAHVEGNVIPLFDVS